MLSWWLTWPDDAELTEQVITNMCFIVCLIILLELSYSAVICPISATTTSAQLTYALLVTWINCILYGRYLYFLNDMVGAGFVVAPGSSRHPSSGAFQPVAPAQVTEIIYSIFPKLFRAVTPHPTATLKIHISSDFTCIVPLNSPG